MSFDPRCKRRIDSNVMVEVYSQGDLYDAVENPRPAPAATPEERRQRIRGSLWMAMALCTRNEITVSYTHEIVNNVVKVGPPDSDAGDRTSALLRALESGGVFEGWGRAGETEGAELGNRARDRRIRTECVRAGLKLITRDGLLTKEARGDGIEVRTPEDFAARVLTLAKAREIFMGRLDRAVAWYRAAKSIVAEHRYRNISENLDMIRAEYGAIWKT